jgi:hypothetical protein
MFEHRGYALFAAVFLPIVWLFVIAATTLPVTPG